MLQHRSYSLLRFIRRNISCCHINQFYVLQIGNIQRNTGIVIAPKFRSRCRFHGSFNSFRIYGDKYKEDNKVFTWASVLIARTVSTDAKSKKGETQKTDDDSAKKENTDGQRIIELKEERLGKLKERVLDVVSEKADDKIEKTKEKKAEKEKGMEKNAVKEDSAKKVPPKKRIRVDHSAASLERNFITPIRAMSDFLLKPSDLESLPKTKRRSPYEYEPPITVYWRKDVEAKALEVWGSRESLLKELLKKELERKMYQQNVFTVKRRLRDYRREMGNKGETIEQEGLFGRSGRVVVTAIIINASNFLFKLFAWVYTGSHSMFSECIHSAADTCNQLILAYGIHKSLQNPNPDHPYGYSNMKYVSSLISGVGIFCVGTGLSFYHGIHGLLFPESVDSFYWAYFILGGSLVSEGATLLVAINSIKKGAEEKRKKFKEYVLTGQDPSVNVVLMEDLAAVIGVVFAASCMGLTSYLDNPMFDAIGSILVGGLLGVVASFIIYTNVAALVGRSIPQENLDKINAELESDIMVRAIHDVKGIDMGNSLVRYKAELDFDGRELTRSYLDKHDLNAMLEEVRKMQNIDELESFLLKHGENIVDMLGGEIDRIELKLKKNHPEIRHCDLEIL
ncbi:zinc transporter 9 [Orussus abietinus]|uniref:zinc transporter 9 n=1 Tax=Orussus abietinus TaxID=222816 RepID=UPI000625A60F|nr:zinc transporter 9 [Orussus abietinus]XP_012288789.1 zinc transporter 9 [Orussus abietinus]XP_012288795.1 zinc transporter 9 [Orussus abietinus]XP_012288803.1 zinc transporter 9 [Orussus abietinus]XP_012288810.1 zinc transporter 9 [Orussus abietinus]XP_023288373.1 zinc transporter 9 [Orussus abietinus]